MATEVYEGSPVPDPDAAHTLSTTAFVEVDGVTTMSTHVDCRSVETRDAMIASGMEGGIQVSYDRMDALVQQLAGG